jgi:cobyrinic acid a,c-diamide synthase
MKGFVLGGTSSGVGKTVATLAVLHALDEAGYDVQPAKAGPDFIDPSHHAEVAGKPSRTLDLWLEGEDGVRRNYGRGEGDICVVEGVMGLYDGDASSTAMVADALGLPVVLVVDASAGMESVAATALGFREYAATAGLDIDVAGVIAQRAHGGRHESGIRAALPDGMTYFGRIPRNDDLEIPERHLGLEMGTETGVPEAALADAAEPVRTERLVETATSPAEPRRGESLGPAGPSTNEAGPTIAVARDSAFCFVYPATVERLRAGATVETFSPVAGDDVPDADGVYLPGGYPELHAGTLSESPSLSSLSELAADGVPILGECGGLMVLTEQLTTTGGRTASMAGVLPASVEMCDRYQALDHVELRARRDVPTADAGDSRRGHEFHYSRATLGGDARFAFDVERGDGLTGEADGLVEYQTLGTYCHCHAADGAFDVFLQRAAGSDV